ncbi:SOS response-associated peptidase [Bellilinea sp.]|jgi:putative SOS response-associated peptidase YedK|uniref:Abasic site processing protein n=1 Tax=Bellilinea caldifistulae TaxID=360411 RepID=A0A7C4KZW8_9CHLR|nr:SOS response-associated peptidase [Bellilinea sp.]
MCGRFSLALDPEELREVFGLVETPTLWIPRYNIAPTQPVAVITDAARPKLDYMRWGLVPSWAKDISIGQKLINARAETIREKPSFRSAFSRRRCLIPADGFFEWKKPEGGKKLPAEPYYFRLRDGKPFAFAGLWEIWHSPEGDELKTCTILTTDANELVGTVHQRMPILFEVDEAWTWLQPLAADTLLALLKPFPAEKMEAYPVSRLVNDPKQDDPQCVQPIG